MRKQTNLAEVKLTALALLSTEINETPYSPMIVKHPFTDTGVSAMKPVPRDAAPLSRTLQTPLDTRQKPLRGKLCTPRVPLISEHAVLCL